MAKKKRPPLRAGQKICYAYISALNDGWMRQKATQTNHTISEVVDAVLSSVRLGVEFKLEKKTLAFIARAQEALERRNERLRSFRKLDRKKKKRTKKIVLPDSTTGFEV